MEKHNKDPGVDLISGASYKSAGIETQGVDDAELAQINKHALTPLSAEDVFVFKAVLCDTEVDRQYEKFSPKALKQLSKLFDGRTVLKDHSRKTDNQVARFYAAEVVDTGKLMKDGQPYQQLVAKAYMVRTSSNADLIKEIQGGIRKEGSVGFRPASSICSICDTDNVKTYCPHWPGRSYDKEGGKQVCTFTLDSVADAYEFSLVAVPAQRAAGVSKSYTGETVYEPDAQQTTDTDKTINTRLRLLEMQARATKGE